MSNNEHQVFEQNMNNSPEQPQQPAVSVPNPEDINVSSQKPQGNSKLLWGIISGIFIFIAGIFLIEWIFLFFSSIAFNLHIVVLVMPFVFLFDIVFGLGLYTLITKKVLPKSLETRLSTIREYTKIPQGALVSIIGSLTLLAIIWIVQPRIEDWYFKMGERFYDSETEKAVVWYRRASIIDPNGFTLINLLQGLGNNPNSPQEIPVGVKALYRLGQIAQDNPTGSPDNNNSTAIQYYEQILAQESCFIDVYYRLSGLYFLQMEYDLAQAKISKGIAMLHLIDAMAENERSQCGLTTVESGSQSSFSIVTQWHYFALLQTAYGRYYVTSGTTLDIDLATTRLDQARVAIDVLREFEAELENLPLDDPNRKKLEILSPQVDDAEFLWHYWRVANERVLERNDCVVFTIAWSFVEENINPTDLRGVQRERYDEIRLRSTQCLS